MARKVQQQQEEEEEEEEVRPRRAQCARFVDRGRVVSDFLTPIAFVGP